MKLFTAAQSRELDRRTIEEHGVPSLQLMENAATALTDVAESMAKSKKRQFSAAAETMAATVLLRPDC